MAHSSDEIMEILKNIHQGLEGNITNQSSMSNKIRLPCKQRQTASCNKKLLI
jgi:hypothetical protein